MTTQTILWIILGSFMVPLCAAIGMGYVLRWRREQFPQPERSPISKKLLRPAGESLRLRIDDLRERFSEQITFALTCPGAVLAAVLLSAADGGMTRGLVSIAFTISAALLLYLLQRAFKTRAELADYQLGFHGERAVAEELNQLMREGCRIFHDLPMEPYGNIDHVIVSPSGVFAVETKARRKRPAPKGKDDYKATFDGTVVHFPTWQETQMVNQAIMQADRLGAKLTRAMAEPVTVQAVLTLPGWYVTSSVPPGKVQVLNPCFIRSIVVNPRVTKLTPELIQRISHKLEEKCRTVDL